MSAVRARLGLVTLLFGLAALGWWWTGDQMRGMDNGPWTGLGSFGWFLGIWVVSVTWMAVVAGLIAFEKTIPWRRVASYGTAGVLLALGLLVLTVPGAIPGLTTPRDAPMQEMTPMEGSRPAG
jgi:hypothetical protein